MGEVESFEKPVRVGVIGLGAMGRHHVRVLAEMPEADLVCVADIDSDTRRVVESSRRVQTYSDYGEMLATEDLEAVVIALPTSLHHQGVVAALDHGVHFLVEKPLAPDLDTARELAALTSTSGLIGAVGHIERYNPVVIAAKNRLRFGELGKVFQLRANRTGPLPPRISDVGVVTDLATHDFDISRYLIDQPVERVFAETAQRIHSNHEDLFSALLRFTDGTIALFDVNWLTPVKIREIRIIGEKGMYRIDLLAQDLYLYENAHVDYYTLDGQQGVSGGRMIRYPIDRAEPLRNELTAFLAAVRGKTSDLVSVADGVAAVALADAMMRSASVHRAVLGDLLEAYEPISL